MAWTYVPTGIDEEAWTCDECSHFRREPVVTNEAGEESPCENCDRIAELEKKLESQDQDLRVTREQRDDHACRDEASEAKIAELKQENRNLKMEALGITDEDIAKTMPPER